MAGNARPQEMVDERERWRRGDLVEKEEMRKKRNVDEGKAVDEDLSEKEGAGERPCKFNAFISYRHLQPDAFVAENLHRMLEAFRLPGNVKRNHPGAKTRIERVFRDKEELPLTSNLEDPIMDALRQSEFLIVICSPRLRESLWCKKEIQTFIELHGREKVLAVLAEGEPEEAFPEELLWREVEKTGPDGEKQLVREPMEPLAADARGKDTKAVKKALRIELMRLLAPMFDCGYDDLRQRHRERRMKRILAAALAGSAVCLAFGSVSTAMALRIRSQKEQIVRQNGELLEDQAQNLAQKAGDLLAEGDRMGAIKTAQEALTGYGDITSMPETAEARYALTEALGVYDFGNNIKPAFQLKEKGQVEFIRLSPQKDKALTGNSLGLFTVWDLNTGRKLLEQNSGWQSSYTIPEQVAFLSEERIAYVNQNWEIAVAEIPQTAEKETVPAVAGEQTAQEETAPVGTGKQTAQEETAPAGTGEQTAVPRAEFIYTDEAGHYLAAVEDARLDLYETGALGENGATLPFRSLETEDGRSFTDVYPQQDGDCLLLIKEGAKESGDTGTYDRKELFFWDPAANKSTPVYPLEPCLVTGAAFADGRAYVLINTEQPAQETRQGVRNVARVLAFNTGTGKLLWETVLEDDFALNLCLPEAPEAASLMVLAGDRTYLLNRTDGVLRRASHFGGEIVGGWALQEREIYLLMGRDGSYYYVDPKQEEDLDISFRLQCPSANLKEAVYTPCGILTLPYLSDRITLLSYIMGGKVTETQEEIPQSSQEKDLFLTGYRSVQEAEKLQLPRAAMVNALVCDPQRTHRFVSYQDGTLEVYETDGNRRVSTIENLPTEITSFLGRDEEGNTYLGSYSIGYILDAAYRPIARVEELAGVDTGRGLLFLQSGEQRCTVPFYDTQALLEAAEKALSSH